MIENYRVLIPVGGSFIGIKSVADANNHIPLDGKGRKVPASGVEGPAVTSSYGDVMLKCTLNRSIAEEIAKTVNFSFDMYELNDRL